MLKGHARTWGFKISPDKVFFHVPLISAHFRSQQESFAAGKFPVQPGFIVFVLKRTKARNKAALEVTSKVLGIVKSAAAA